MYLSQQTALIIYCLILNIMQLVDGDIALRFRVMADPNDAAITRQDKVFSLDCVYTPMASADSGGLGLAPRLQITYSIACISWSSNLLLLLPLLLLLLLPLLDVVNHVHLK